MCMCMFWIVCLVFDVVWLYKTNKTGTTYHIYWIFVNWFSASVTFIFEIQFLSLSLSPKSVRYLWSTVNIIPIMTNAKLGLKRTFQLYLKICPSLVEKVQSKKKTLKRDRKEVRSKFKSFQACKGDTNPTIIKGLWAEIEIITVMNNFAKQLRNLLFHKSKYHKIKNPSQKFLRPYQV